MYIKILIVLYVEVYLKMGPKLSATVSVVKLNDQILEFFKTNTRQQVRIKVKDDSILQLVNSLDGKKDIDQLVEEQNIDRNELQNLLDFLRIKGILDNVNPKSDFKGYEKYRRVIHFLSEYAVSHEHLLEMWENINSATVMIVGLGAVGTWVACNLAETGVGKLIFMDGDTVDITNLHRQYGFREEDVGKYKVDALEQRIHEYSKEIQIVKISQYLEHDTLNKVGNVGADLIINCADKPNVDTTSLWIGEYCMQHDIPHIIGGGYNMHLSLIGQTVLPGKTACVKCFQTQLEKENHIDSSIVKKLAVKNRKVGSFAPMCSLIASMVGMEAVKVLTRYIEPSNTNRRGEFDIYTMDIKYKQYEKRDDCEWCGENGKYCGA